MGVNFGIPHAQSQPVPDGPESEMDSAVSAQQEQPIQRPQPRTGPTPRPGWMPSATAGYTPSEIAGIENMLATTIDPAGWRGRHSEEDMAARLKNAHIVTQTQPQ